MTPIIIPLSIIIPIPKFCSPSKLIAIQRYGERVSRFREYQRRRKKAWMARERGRRGSRIKPLCSKVSRTFSHGDSSRLITNSKASSPTGEGNTQPRLFVPVLLPLLRPTFRCFRNEIGEPSLLSISSASNLLLFLVDSRAGT